MYLFNHTTNWTNCTEASSGVTTCADLSVAQVIMMTISALRISGHTACGVLSARSNNFYHWFAPLFCMEAIMHMLHFIREFLFNYYNEWLIERQTFCIILETDYQFITNISIFLYVWAIFYFLFQEDEFETHPCAFILFSTLFILTLIATIIDAILKEESICGTWSRTGVTLVFTVTGTIVECLTILMLIGWWACGPHTGHRDRHTWFIILFTAVASKLPGYDVFRPLFFTHAYSYVLIPLRAFPLIYPIVFIYVTKDKLYTSFRLVTSSEID